MAFGSVTNMGKALYCPFPTCKTEYYTYCPKHQELLPAIHQVIAHIDPDGILSESVNIANLQPMVKQLEELWLQKHRLEMKLKSVENELQKKTLGM